ncbi:MAG: hypothetical protein B6I35_00910 [Anaerolineaceae bacterium 4572_32.2]|nr:MAG: hypothetical protein B6I35_00910 [Anaerolineaceae bacterium 4572_32.2]
MDKIIAYCGLVCTDCPAYVATQSDDNAARERVAAQWREEFDAPNITAEMINCNGCLSETGPKFSHCAECEIRACSVERGVVNCAHCTEYACEKLEGFFGFAPDARVVLDGVRQNLI